MFNLSECYPQNKYWNDDFSDAMVSNVLSIADIVHTGFHNLYRDLFQQLVILAVYKNPEYTI